MRDDCQTLVSPFRFPIKMLGSGSQRYRYTDHIIPRDTDHTIHRDTDHNIHRNTDHNIHRDMNPYIYGDTNETTKISKTASSETVTTLRETQGGIDDTHSSTSLVMYKATYRKILKQD